MPFAIELLFDAKSDENIRKWGRHLERNNVTTSFSIPGSSPHFALSVFEKYHPERLVPVLKKLASRFAPIPFSLSSIGSFPGKEGALFLAPPPIPRLLQIHSALYDSIRGMVKRAWGHYIPGQWVPHCTIGINLSPRTLAKGFQLIQGMDFYMKGRCNRLVLVEFRPVRKIISIPLAGDNREFLEGHF